MVSRVLIDTCVWLDLAKDHRSQPILGALEELIRLGAVSLVVPQTILDEFERNRERVADEASQGAKPHFRLVREAVTRFADETKRKATLAALAEVDHKIATSGAEVSGALAKIESILRRSRILPLSDAIKSRVAERALRGAAPYHRNKNSVGDAILVETYADLVAESQASNAPCAFVTHNFRDFSDAHSDRRSPHPDLSELFESGTSTYWMSLADFIRHIEPDLLADHDFEFNYSQQPRGLSELLEAEHLLFRQVWYNRHLNLRSQIASGHVRLIDERELSRSPYKQDEVLDSVWDRALIAAQTTEDELGPENLGPWTDFEWGMLNGKLSALRWVLGDEWDFLDT